MPTAAAGARLGARLESLALVAGIVPELLATGRARSGVATGAGLVPWTVAEVPPAQPAGSAAAVQALAIKSMVWSEE